MNTCILQIASVLLQNKHRNNVFHFILLCIMFPNCIHIFLKQCSFIIVKNMVDYLPFKLFFYLALLSKVFSEYFVKLLTGNFYLKVMVK
jgi:hypothetical protein